MSLLRFGNIDLSQASAIKRCKTWLKQEYPWLFSLYFTTQTHWKPYL
jgi:hypothetical protein